MMPRTAFEETTELCRAVLRDPSASRWLQDAMRAALHRDPTDAANDAEYLASVLAARAKAAVTR
jgi:hypothetical protein